MALREPVMVCDGVQGGVCVGSSTCFVTGAAPTLDSLLEAMDRWLWHHPSYTALSFSHAAETRWEPRVGLAGPGATTVYTGVLLVQTQQRKR